MRSKFPALPVRDPRLLRILFATSILATLTLSTVAPASAGAISNASGFYDDTWKML
jgi:hypothetical protein